MHLVIDDAGRSASRHPQEQNDCSVRAIAKCLGIPYDKAYSMLVRQGREQDKPFRIVGYLKRHRKFDGAQHKLRYGYGVIKLHQFADDNPDGSYVVLVNRHVTTCINGTIYDDHTLAPYRSVYTSWKLKQHKITTT